MSEFLLTAASYRGNMLFMMIERFRDNDMVPIYRRVRDQGRSLEIVPVVPSAATREVVAPYLDQTD